MYFTFENPQHALDFEGYLKSGASRLGLKFRIAVLNKPWQCQEALSSK